MSTETNNMYSVRLKLSAGCLKHFTKNKISRKSNQTLIRRRLREISIFL